MTNLWYLIYWIYHLSYLIESYHNISIKSFLRQIFLFRKEAYSYHDKNFLNWRDYLSEIFFRYVKDILLKKIVYYILWQTSIFSISIIWIFLIIGNFLIFSLSWLVFTNFAPFINIFFFDRNSSFGEIKLPAKFQIGMNRFQ